MRTVQYQHCETSKLLSFRLTINHVTNSINSLSVGPKCDSSAHSVISRVHVCSKRPDSEHIRLFDDYCFISFTWIHLDSTRLSTVRLQYPLSPQRPTHVDQPLHSRGALFHTFEEREPGRTWQWRRNKVSVNVPKKVIKSFLLKLQ